MADEYSPSDIKILSGLNAVRKRPGMFIGDTDDGTGLLQMLWEVFSNSLDQFLAGKCTTISVIIHANNMLEILDDGKGIRVDEINGKPFLEAVMTELHHTATFDGHAPHTHVGSILGVGIAVVNALSSKVEVNIYRDGYHWNQLYKDGEPSTLIKQGISAKTGTSFKFLPDETIFSNLDYDQSTIKRRLTELAYLNPGLKIQFEDHRTLKKEICSQRGISDFLEDIQNRGGDSYSSVIKGTTEFQGLSVDVAFCWHEYGNEVKSFANQLCTVDGGAHVKGLIDGIAAGLKKACKGKLKVDGFKGVIQDNLSAIVNVNIADPEFASPTKDRLINPAARKAVKEVTENVAYKHFTQNEDILSRLADKYVSRQIHKRLIKSYKDNGRVANVSVVQSFVKELFEESNGYEHIIDNLKDTMKYFGELNPKDVSPYFLTG